MTDKTPMELINEGKTILDEDTPEQKHVEFTEDKQYIERKPWQELASLRDRISWAVNPHKKPNMQGIQSWFDEEKDKHIIMLDYDVKEGITPQAQAAMVFDVQKIQKEYGLSDAHIFKTNKGYHVFFLDIVPFLTAFNAIFESQADYWFKIYPFRKHLERCWTLRVSPKNDKIPEYFITLPREGVYDKSKGHALFLRARGAPITNEELEHMQSSPKGLLFCKYYQKVI